jgi:serine/threonine protein kinase/tetratricopeptide (TPR) repeat protein
MPRNPGNAPPPDGYGHSVPDDDLTADFVSKPRSLKDVAGRDGRVPLTPHAPASTPVPAAPADAPQEGADDERTTFEAVDDDATKYEPAPNDVTAHEAPDPDATTYRPLESDVTTYQPPSSVDVTTYQPFDPDVTRYVPFERGAQRPKTQTPGSAVRRPNNSGVRPLNAGAAAGSSSADGPLTVGQPFGTRYHITRVLGVGGMGAVYQAWDDELGVDVAVKVIRPEIVADAAAASEIERRFKRELLLARQVTHPNIIRIHDLGDIDGIKYITMPFIEGSDLATILKQEKTLPVPRAMRIARGTVSGLISAHEAGVIHRDLKPANIMVGTNDVPTIMDFGIARSAGGPGQGPAPKSLGLRPSDLSRTNAAAASSTMAGAIVGTVAYMAPEQARGEAVDQRADIYAFGLILYDMLIGGRRSERAISAIAELQERMHTAPPPPRSIDPSIPEAVDAIIRRCLEPDLTKRFQATVELQEAFDRLDDNGKPLPIMRRLTRRNMAAAALVVAVLLGGTFYTTRQLSTPVVEHAPVTVLIADFQNSTDDPNFGSTIGQTTKRALESASFITAFDRTRVRSTFQIQPPEKFDQVAARELAVKQGLSYVLAGSVAPRGNGYEIAVQATQPLTGKVVADVTQRASNKSDVLATVTRVVSTVRTALGDDTAVSAQQAAMRSLSTGSLDVLTHYAAAVDAQSKGRFAEALESFTKAVELDPKFGLGYQGMAVMLSNLGRLQEAENYAKEGLKYLDNMTERERFAARANYYARTGDYKQCVSEYGLLVEKYPADVVAHNLRAGCLLQLRDFQRAGDDLREITRILPEHPVYRTNLALTLSYAGKFGEAEEEVKKLSKPYPQATAVLALSELAQGRVKEAAATYQQLRAMDPWGASFGTAGLADLALYEGRFSEAARLFEEGATADLAAKNADGASLKLAGAAYAHLASGANRQAAAAAEKALEHSTATPVRFLAARTFAQTGDFARAQKLAHEFTSALPAESQAYGKIIEGLIALQKKDAKLAIKILTDANAILDTWLGRFDLGRAYVEAGAFLQADSEFDRCLQRRGEALAVVNEDPSYGYVPIVYYYRGRAREGLKTAGFGDAYRQYLSIRGQSTEDPLVADVKKRLGE